MKIQLIRNATLWVEYGGANFLIDPMFSEAGANPPVQNSENDRRNPLVPLPGSLDQWLSPDIVIVTHLHPDHWDQTAAAKLGKTTPIFCQPGDKDVFLSAGFLHVTEVQDQAVIGKVRIFRTEGRHGTGEIGKAMGPVSGFIFLAEQEPSLYLAGDTILCGEVQNALDSFKPQVTVLNAGGARFIEGDPIIMDEEDVVQTAQYAPYTQIIAVHMDAINHCLLTRDKLRERLLKEGLLGRVSVPEDGQWI